MDSFLQPCSARTWTQLSSNNKILIQRNRKKLKITVCTLSWSKRWTQKTERDQKPQLPVLKSLEYKNSVSGAKTGYWACPLHTHTHTHTSHPFGLTPGQTSTLTPHKEHSLTPPEPASKGNCCLFLLSPATTEPPTKPCLNFLFSLYSISIDWGRRRTLVCNNMTVKRSHSLFETQFIHL